MSVENADSSLSDPVSESPSDATLEQALRRAVVAIYQSGHLEELTVKRVRTASERALDLQEGFFKTPTWKDRSKRIIENEVDVRSDTVPEEPGPSRLTPIKSVSKKATSKSTAPSKKPGNKRISQSDQQPPKRRKVVQKAEQASDGESSVVGESGYPATSNRSPEDASPQIRGASGNKRDVSDNEPSDEAEEKVVAVRKTAPSRSTIIGGASDSEMSDVIDDGPKTKRKRGSDSTEAKVKSTEKLKGKPTKDKSSKEKPGKEKKSLKDAAPAQEADPDVEEIKRLQGWLVKCGIRKLWYRELAQHNNAKAKIRHLKNMLTEAGMSGRFSTEKATQIKEARELAADLEAVQAGAKQWGMEISEEEEEKTTRPKRRLARGLQNLDFLNDDDGEETD